MKSRVRRWVRLDITWSGSEWIVPLRPGGRLAWVELLGYVKANGAGGRAKAMGAKGAGKRWAIPARDVQSMLDAAQEDDAIRTENGDWVVTNWPRYQEIDTTAAERMRKYRAKTKGSDALRRNTRNKSRNLSRDRDSDSDSDRDSDLRKKAPSGPKKARARVPLELPATWTPNGTHARIAAEQHVDLEREAAQFRDHAATHARTAQDWDAAFRTWLRKSVPNGNGGGAQVLADERVRRTAQDVTAKLQSRGRADG